jgi:hypothetical protein
MKPQKLEPRKVTLLDRWNWSVKLREAGRKERKNALKKSEAK